MRKNCLIIALFCFLICLFAGKAMAEEVTLTLNYDANMTNVTGFKVYVSTVSGEYVQEDVVATIDYVTGQASYTTDSTLPVPAGTATTYYFVATAFNDEQESKYSNEVNKTFLGAPENLTFSLTLQTD